MVPGLVTLRWLVLAFVAVTVACSGAHKQPVGPAPEYEDAPPPSWLKDAGAAPAPSSAPPPAPTLVPPPAADGGLQF